MSDNGVYRKTEKGRSEILTRANKLGLRERTMLIMVDDKTSRQGLLSRSAHSGTGDILNFLLDQGYIETVPDNVPATASAAAAIAPPLASPAVTTDAATEVSLTSASRFACRALVTYLGPSADDLTVVIEEAADASELAVAFDKCRQILQAIAGKGKADEFWSGVSARLPRD